MLVLVNAFLIFHLKRKAEQKNHNVTVKFVLTTNPEATFTVPALMQC